LQPILFHVFPHFSDQLFDCRQLRPVASGQPPTIATPAEAECCFGCSPVNRFFLAAFSLGASLQCRMIANRTERGCVRGAPAAAVESFRDSGSIPAFSSGSCRCGWSRSRDTAALRGRCRDAKLAPWRLKASEFNAKSQRRQGARKRRDIGVCQPTGSPSFQPQSPDVLALFADVLLPVPAGWPCLNQRPLRQRSVLENHFAQAGRGALNSTGSRLNG
jgi:hypothetical protein